MHKKDKKMGLFEILWKLLCMSFKDGGGVFTLYIIIGVAHGASIGINTIMTQNFFDKVEAGTQNEVVLNTVILWGVALGAMLILNQILNGVHNFMAENLAAKLVGKIMMRVTKKMGKLNILKFENTETLDVLKKVDEGAQISMYFVFISITIVTFYIPYFIMMGFYMYSLKPILAFSLVLIFIPVVLTQIVRLKLFTKLTDESAPIKREFLYYEKCMTDKEYFKETRLLGGVRYFMDLYKSSLSLLNKKIWQTKKKSDLMEIYMKMITLCGYMGVLYLLVDTLIKGDISIGAFGAVFASIGMMFSIMEEIICRHFGSLSESMGSVRSLMEFFKMEEREGQIEVDNSRPDIKVENGFFRYPGADKDVLKNINLHIKSGETIAVVGENGSGKTTLVKFLTGLYEPTEGCVFFNGVDTKEADTLSLHKNVSAVFQKFQRYKMSLGDNIAVSELADVLSNDKKKLDECAQKADFEMDVEKFKDGYDTMMSREFKGVELSGGQWQRIAIARGFYRDYNTIILDEPTAAIDPIEETRLYNKFASMAKNNTAILVTHRLGSAKIADRIVVMDKGEIAEIGTHDELINNKGKYSEMYRAQSKWYDDTAVEALV